MYANRQNFRACTEIMVEEHDGDVRFSTGSVNTAVSRKAQCKIRNTTLIYGRIAEISAS